MDTTGDCHFAVMIGLILTATIWCVFSDQSLATTLLLTFEFGPAAKKSKYYKDTFGGEGERAFLPGYPDNLHPDSINGDQLRNSIDPSDGSATIEVDLEIYVPKREVFYPTIYFRLPFWSDLYNEEEGANVTFDVNGKRFMAHKNVLKIQAPGLYEMVRDAEDSNAPISITDTDETCFDIIHRFIYTMLDRHDEVGLHETMEQARAFLVAADKAGCKALKLYAESVIVDTLLTPATCAELLVTADSYSCAQLKEAAIDLQKFHPLLVMQTDGWKNLISNCPKLLNEVLLFIYSHINSLDVPSLLREMQEAKLDLDGSKEILIQRWNDHQKGSKNQ